MRKPINPNFERMRVDSELQRLAGLEAKTADLASEFDAQSKVTRAERDALQAQNEALKAALEEQLRSGTAISADLERLSKQVSEVDVLSADPALLRRAIAPVLSGAMRDAGEEGRDPMSSAIAPYILKTIRTEILNSEEELIEAIHPRLGTLISASISNAIGELNRKVDDALPFDRWMAAMKGRITGAPPAGWLLEDGVTFMVKEAMLIERQSGILLASERRDLDEDDAGPDEDLMAGMIAALQGFASEAYGARGAGDLRRFSFTEDTVYLRCTPTKILALRCSGIAPPEIERQVDELLLTALENSGEEGALDGPLLLLEDFNAPVRTETDDAVSPSKVVGLAFGGLAACIAVIWGHSAVQGAHEARWLSSVEQAVTADSTISPYPMSVMRADDDAPITVSGLLPDEAAKAALEQRLFWLASPIPLELDIALLSEGAE